MTLLAQLCAELGITPEQLEAVAAEMRGGIRSYCPARECPGHASATPPSTAPKPPRQRRRGPLSADAVRRAEEVSRRHGIEPGE